jgi:hypothetical protein
MSASRLTDGRPWRAQAALLSGIAVLILMLAGACRASAARSVFFEPSFSSWSHLGESGTFTATFTLIGGEYAGEVDPVTEVAVHVPEGIGGSRAGFATCAKATIEERGIGACPAGSLAGPPGWATMFVAFGTERVEEYATVQAVFGPGEALYFYINGDTPVSIELLGAATYTSDTPPYGRVLKVSIPLIESVPGAPDASITSLTLELGAFGEESGAEIASVILPSQCAAGHFSWAADAKFEQEASAPAGTAETPCPRTGVRTSSKTTLNASTTTPYEEEVVTYTATVSSRTTGGPAPTGDLAFRDDGQVIPECAAQPLSLGSSSSVATCSVSYSYPTYHRIVAEYAGDATYGHSESGAAEVEVAVTEAPKGGGGTTGGETKGAGNTGGGAPPTAGTGSTADAGASVSTASAGTASTAPSTPATSSKPLTQTQKLAKALKACKKEKPKSKRKTCEGQARKRYDPKLKQKVKKR